MGGVDLLFRKLEGVLRRGNPEAVGQGRSSQLPLFSQNMQKWFPSTNIMSMILRRCCSSGSVSFSITMPSMAGFTQAAWGRPSTNTVQMRQLPIGRSSLWEQSRGM